MPGSKPADLDFDKDGVHINNVTENDRKQLAAARSIYDNLINQKNNLPTKTITYTEDLGNGPETWTEVVPDFSKLEPVNYIDADGNVQTYAVDPNDPALNKDMGFTVGVIDHLHDDIATRFPSINKSQKVSVKENPGGPTEITFGLPRFGIEVIELDDTGGAQ